MKRIIIICVTAALSVLLSGCGSYAGEENSGSDVMEQSSLAEINDMETLHTDSLNAATEPSENPELSAQNSNADKKDRRLPVPEYGNVRISLAWDDKEITVRLIDNGAAENLLAMLPMSLSFEDYRDRQKTGVIANGLDIGNSPVECDCFIGDMNYYAPWKMLTFFYQDFGYAPDLTPLGTIESGAEFLGELDNGSLVTVSEIN